jgi:iron uptake system EfeUOB component EfeO/EfeM
MLAARRPPLRLLTAVLAALVVVLLVAALRPGSDDDGPVRVAGVAHPGVAPAPNPHAKATIHHIANSRLSAQATADAASAKPTAAGPRGEVQPLPVSAFHAPVAAWRGYAIKDARAMVAPVAAITAKLRAGDRAGAKAAWGKAYDKYRLLGAAYGALGSLDAAIDGGPGGQPLGLRDPHFTGLHRIEHDLWTNRPPAAIVPFARRLQRDVARLPHALVDMSIAPLDYATRAHEILEDAQRDQLSDVAAPWSGAGLRATADDLQATRTVIATLRPVLAGRGAVLQPVLFNLDAFGRRLTAVRRAHGGRWPTLSAMTPREHTAINGSLGALLEALSGVPGDLETVLPPAIPALPRPKKETK